MREQERKKMLRLEKAGLLNRKAQMKLVEKNVETGLEKIHRNEKERLLREERTKKRMELKETKEDLWRLRRKKKKIGTNDEIKKITELGNMAGKIV